jgi:L-fucose isomerase-like protein
MGKIGVVSYTDPRSTSFVRERERYIEKKHKELIRFLKELKFEVVDPAERLRKGWKEIFGVQTNAENRECVRNFLQSDVDGIVICVWHWTEPQLVVSMVRDLNRPVALVTEHDPAWAGSVGICAAGASLWESSANYYGVNHERFMGDREGLAKWARGISALQAQRRGTLILWGGTYCLRMEHLQDDIPLLKTFLIGDIISEDQYILIKRAENIFCEQSQRIKRFRNWLSKGGTRIDFDGKMLTPEVLERQISFYLAARDRLKEMSDDNIIGVSIKCQPEFSDEYGITACTLPAFLPFSRDAEGKQQIIPTVCEGDIKGLLTSTLLHQIQPEVPPLFGDLKFVSNKYLTISNCGASSIYYAANSHKVSEVLPRVTIGPQCQGASGGAIGYSGLPQRMTVARLYRIEGEYRMQLALGETLAFTPKMKRGIIWGKTWPHIAIHLDIDAQQFIKRAGSNHYIAMPGDFRGELKCACQAAGIAIEEF